MVEPRVWKLKLNQDLIWDKPSNTQSDRKKNLNKALKPSRIQKKRVGDLCWGWRTAGRVCGVCRWIGAGPRRRRRPGPSSPGRPWWAPERRSRRGSAPPRAARRWCAAPTSSSTASCTAPRSWLQETSQESYIHGSIFHFGVRFGWNNIRNSLIGNE